MYGADNDYVMHDLLGPTPADIHALRQSGVVR